MKNRLRKKLTKFYAKYYDLRVCSVLGTDGRKINAKELQLFCKLNKKWQKIKKRNCHRQYLREAWEKAFQSC